MTKSKKDSVKDKLISSLLDDLNSNTRSGQAKTVMTSRSVLMGAGVSSDDEEINSIAKALARAAESQTSDDDSDSASEVWKDLKKSIKKKKKSPPPPPNLQESEAQGEPLTKVAPEEEPPTQVAPLSSGPVVPPTPILDEAATIVTGEQAATQVLQKTSDPEEASKTEVVSTPNTETSDQTVRIKPLATPEPDLGAVALASLHSVRENTFTGGVRDQKLQIAHYLKIAQDKIMELEAEVDRLREDNDLLTIAAQASRKQAEEFSERLTEYEQRRVEVLEQAQLEVNIYRENLASKEKERKALEDRIQDLESSISREIKKVRHRERELENRLEISKHERAALLKAKDESILDLRRKVDDLNLELENYRNRFSDLNKKVESQHGQLSRTVKALRLALAHLESQGESNVTPLKKAE